MMPNDHFLPTPRQARPSPRAFTLIELMVSVGLMVLLILAIGITFQSTSRAVGLSKATMEMLSNVRAAQQQLERDISGMDRNSFLIIQPTPVVNGGYVIRNYDQISFISFGHFQNRTGAGTSATSLFTDITTANAAFVWWGQLAIEQASLVAGGNYVSPAQGTAPFLSVRPPSGLADADFILGRNTILLVPRNQATGTVNANPCGNLVPSFASFGWNAATVVATGDGTASHITKSRVAVAALVPANQVAPLLQAGTIQANPQNYCYRFATLRSPYDSELAFPGQLLNGYFRMHPIVLQGVASFKIEWTDGTSGANGLNWYNTGSCWSSTTPPLRASWPKALRFTYHIADPTNRMPNGRDFVEVVKVPD